jgi:hypothetical protein
MWRRPFSQDPDPDGERFFGTPKANQLRTRQYVFPTAFLPGQCGYHGQGSRHDSLANWASSYEALGEWLAAR